MTDMIERVAIEIYGRGEITWRRNKNTIGAQMAMGAARRTLATIAAHVPVIRENGEVVHELHGSPESIWRLFFDTALTQTRSEGE